MHIATSLLHVFQLSGVLSPMREDVRIKYICSSVDMLTSSLYSAGLIIVYLPSDRGGLLKRLISRFRVVAGGAK